jgi:hypothetical protein
MQHLLLRCPPHVGIVHEVRIIEVIEKPMAGDLPVNKQIKHKEKEGHKGFQNV